jgi:hypothetical protein
MDLEIRNDILTLNMYISFEFLAKYMEHCAENKKET